MGFGSFTGLPFVTPLRNLRSGASSSRTNAKPWKRSLRNRFTISRLDLMSAETDLSAFSYLVYLASMFAQTAAAYQITELLAAEVLEKRNLGVKSQFLLLFFRLVEFISIKLFGLWPVVKAVSKE